MRQIVCDDKEPLRFNKAIKSLIQEKKKHSKNTINLNCQFEHLLILLIWTVFMPLTTSQIEESGLYHVLKNQMIYLQFFL